MELKIRRRQKGESLQSLFLDVKRLMALAFPGQNGSMAEITAIDAFVDSFTDHDLRKQVLHKSPTTLAEALTWAIRIEAIDDRSKYDMKCPHDAPYDTEGRRDHRKPHRAHAQSAVSTPSKTHSPPSKRPWTSMAGGANVLL